jgi:L-threonylcarbamoyladenylate synthase
MRTVILSADDPLSLDQAVQALRRGGLVAFPTDTVYGVGAHIFQRAAIRRLYKVKGRGADKAIPVLLPNIDALLQVALPLTSPARRLAERFWPGPLTLVVPRRPDLPFEINTGPTVGVRVPGHPIALALLAAAGPLAVTSANRSGGADSLSAAEVSAALGDGVELLLDGGRTPGGVPSTVVDCTQAQPSVLRAGPIPAEAVLAAWAGD